eukprot:SAG22_NODE_1528_length_4218_cov_30.416363_5_plen_318_part_00
MASPTMRTFSRGRVAVLDGCDNGTHPRASLLVRASTIGLAGPWKKACGRGGLGKVFCRVCNASFLSSLRHSAGLHQCMHVSRPGLCVYVTIDRYMYSRIRIHPLFASPCPWTMHALESLLLLLSQHRPGRLGRLQPASGARDGANGGLHSTNGVRQESCQGCNGRRVCIWPPRTYLREAPPAAKSTIGLRVRPPPRSRRCRPLQQAAGTSVQDVSERRMRAKKQQNSRRPVRPSGSPAMPPIVIPRLVVTQPASRTAGPIPAALRHHRPGRHYGTIAQAPSIEAEPEQTASPERATYRHTGRRAAQTPGQRDCVNCE